MLNSHSAVAQKILKYFKIKNAYADIFIVSEREIRKLNRDFRGKDKPTNVLSFPYPQSFPSPKKGKVFLGEIYLCPEYVKRHKENLNYMLIHGVLHLLGFDHIEDDDRILMEGLEAKLMDKFLAN